MRKSSICHTQRATQLGNQWKCGVTGDAAFALAATDGAMTMEHTHGNGAYTWIQVLTGEKVVGVKTGSPSVPDSGPKLSEWQCVTLRPRDFM